MNRSAISDLRVIMMKFEQTRRRILNFLDKSRTTHSLDTSFHI